MRRRARALSQSTTWGRGLPPYKQVSLRRDPTGDGFVGNGFVLVMWISKYWVYSSNFSKLKFDLLLRVRNIFLRRKEGNEGGGVLELR